jgi:hypothetical protein
MEGYIRLHRTLPDWEWYHDDACLRLLIHLLMRVNWKPGRWKGMDVQPGSMVTSIERLAEGLGWSRSKLRHTLDKLKSSGDVTSTTTNHWTAVTLVNWAKYQNGDQQSSQPSDQPTADRWPTEQPTNSQPMATIEEGKKERRKEGKKIVAGKPPKRDAEWFKAECAKAVADNPDLLVTSERKGFFDYWTERSTSGKMRFEGEKYFDFARRMRTWQTNATKVIPFGNKPTQRSGPMSRSEAKAVLDQIRVDRGIPPGGLVETQFIPQEVRDAMQR